MKKVKTIKNYIIAENGKINKTNIRKYHWRNPRRYPKGKTGRDGRKGNIRTNY